MRRQWTDREREELKRIFPDNPTREVAEALGRSQCSINTQAHLMGLKKSADYMEREKPGQWKGDVGIQFRFPKGNEPWNKGKSYVAGGNSAKTRFKKGQRPHTWLPVGSERVSKDGIRQRKISDTGYGPRDWKSVHSILWEEHNGPIPEGHLVVFRNGRREDIWIENLELITRAENARRNTIHRYPPEVKAAIRAAGKLKRTIKKHEERQS